MLHIASSMGNPDAVGLLLGAITASGSCHLIDAPNSNGGQRPLHYAASKGHLDVIRILLDAGADIFQANKYHQTALHRAASQGRVGVIRCLIDHAARMTSKGKQAKSQLFLDLQDIEGNTALHMANEDGWNDVVDVLLEAGASRDIVNNEGTAAA